MYNVSVHCTMYIVQHQCTVAYVHNSSMVKIAILREASIEAEMP